MEITSVSYFSIESKDKPGEVARFTSTLKEENLDLAGLWGLSLGDGEAQIIAIPKDPDKFASAAQRAGIIATRGTCFRVVGEDRIGALADILENVAARGINLYAIDAISLGDQFASYLWAKEHDVDVVREIITSDKK